MGRLETGAIWRPRARLQTGAICSLRDRLEFAFSPDRSGPCKELKAIARSTVGLALKFWLGFERFENSELWAFR